VKGDMRLKYDLWRKCSTTKKLQLIILKILEFKKKS